MAVNRTPLRLSVHALVDFMLRQGDIDTRIFNKASMQAGTKLHQKYQSQQEGSYNSEFFLTHTYEVDDYDVTIEGYADGIRQLLDKVYIEEIKTTIAELETFADANEQWHRMQAALYGHMYALAHDLSFIRIRIIYINQVDETMMIRNYEEEVTDLGQRILDLIKGYLDFYRLVAANILKRDQSVAALTFPYKEFRPGQRELAKYVYAMAKNRGHLLAEAPTGIGKTISTLYPTILSFGKTLKGKIFYVTAKNSGHEAALSACARLIHNGADFNYIAITAKEKICFTPGAGCNPDECPFAKGYYDKIRVALNDILNRERSLSRDIIVDNARLFGLCPFELQLDLALFTDVIIGDYNYVFDPTVYLRRFFDVDASAHFLLVDEAHNLVERSRSMYSASVTNASFTAMRKSVKKIKHPKFKRTITKLKKLFEQYDLRQEPYDEVIKLPADWFPALDAFNVQTLDVMRHHPDLIGEPLKDFYFDSNRFLRLAEYFDDHFVYTQSWNASTGYALDLMCLDSSALIKKTIDQFKASVMFSATLSPLEYFVPMLGGTTETPVLKLPSPFPRENLLLMVAPKVATRYTKRTATLGEVALYIELAVNARLGNYLVFFPSYKYMNEVVKAMKWTSDIQVLVQDPDMKAEAQTAFLDRFQINPSRTTVGFVVLGGLFAEGIDLIEDRLIGSIVIGVGLPQLSFERDLIRDYFNAHNGDGYAFSYEYPGMNRVMQAVGRVIRSEKDRGIALLIDDRYLESRYRNLFKSEWSDYEAVIDPDDLERLLHSFWSTKLN